MIGFTMKLKIPSGENALAILIMHSKSVRSRRAHWTLKVIIDYFGEKLQVVQKEGENET